MKMKPQAAQTLLRTGCFFFSVFLLTKKQNFNIIVDEETKRRISKGECNVQISITQ